MNIGIISLASCCWGLLFLQGLHASPNDVAPWFFFGAGIAQWVAGVTFVGAYRELKDWLNTW